MCGGDCVEIKHRRRLLLKNKPRSFVKPVIHGESLKRYALVDGAVHTDSSLVLPYTEMTLKAS